MGQVRFHIEYHTSFGQDVYICGSHKQLGDGDETHALRLNYNNAQWSVVININDSGPITYYYLIKEDGVVTRREWGGHRNIHIVKSKDFNIRDCWRDKPTHDYLHSSLFTEGVFRHTIKQNIRYYKNSLMLLVNCPYVKKGHKLVVAGDNDILGNWDLSLSPVLEYYGDATWGIQLDKGLLPKSVNFKFAIIDPDNTRITIWEEGNNRAMNVVAIDSENSVEIIAGIYFRFGSFSFKGSGTAIPVFSLRSKSSFGIGDFEDLRLMIDWAERTGQQVIQVLPINDTTTSKTWTDSYPYNAISSYALHPIYLGLHSLPLRNKKQLNQFLKEATELNKLDKLDYEKVFNLKLRYKRALFKQDGAKVLSSDSFLAFYEQNKSWLFTYAAYSYLRDRYNTCVFHEWQEYATYSKSKLTALFEENEEAKELFDYYTFLQYLLDKQLKEAKQYANSKGIGLKGDIPIGINRFSVEAWQEPHLFNMDTQTGAPPDDFSVSGQNWGFPTYNWDMMEQEGFAWWKRRFQKMADYFDAYRIDHILGFFRIWEIPLHSVQGLLGQFNPALPYTPGELVTAGIPFDERRMAEPFIHENFLSELFGEFSEEVKEKYLESSGWQQFKLKSEFNSQKKIQNYFGHITEEKNQIIRDGLYALCNEVLFVRDHDNHNLYHPRISAYNTYSYKYLEQRTKEAFYKLYEDFFYHRHNSFWGEEAMKKLPPLISSTQMLCCGEDLGMIPGCVHPVMDELGILSLEIQRMPKEYNQQFADLNRLPYLSVATTSTHDMSPLRLWWEENRMVTQNYYNSVLKHYGDAPCHITSKLSKMIVDLHLDSTAMFVILPLQDWMSVSEKLSDTNPADDRINIPASPNHYWRWRMHITLEQLIGETEFNNEISNAIASHLRS